DGLRLRQNDLRPGRGGPAAGDRLDHAVHPTRRRHPAGHLPPRLRRRRPGRQRRGLPRPRPVLGWGRNRRRHGNLRLLHHPAGEGGDRARHPRTLRRGGGAGARRVLPPGGRGRGGGGQGRVLPRRPQRSRRRVGERHEALRHRPEGDAPGDERRRHRARRRGGRPRPRAGEGLRRPRVALPSRQRRQRPPRRMRRPRRGVPRSLRRRSGGSLRRHARPARRGDDRGGPGERDRAPRL
ncbi:MAG: Lipoate-protein ligase A, partial [uncultured Rubrobacteraceae bacterium]